MLNKLKECKSIALILLIILFGCGGSETTNNKSEANEVITSTLPTSVQEILDDAVKSGIDGAFLYIEQTNTINESYASGIQDRSTQLPADAHSLFKVASISKLFIAVSAVKIVIKEQLSLNDTLASWLPDLADRIENSSTITIEHMLQHRSGIPDFDSQTGFDWKNSHKDIDRTLLYALDKKADFSPNSQYEYSNTNYLLIAKILDKALGYSHHVYIQENIITPLAMEDTYLTLSEIDMSLLAKGYWDDIESSSQDYVIPGGSMISTVKDIAIFIRALNTGTLLSETEKNIYSSVYWFNHSGWLPGYQSIASYDKQTDAVVVLFINTTGGNSESITSATNEQILEFLAN